LAFRFPLSANLSSVSRWNQLPLAGLMLPNSCTGPYHAVSVTVPLVFPPVQPLMAYTSPPASPPHRHKLPSLPSLFHPPCSTIWERILSQTRSVAISAGIWCAHFLLLPPLGYAFPFTEVSPRASPSSPLFFTLTSLPVLHFFSDFVQLTLAPHPQPPPGSPEVARVLL